MKTKTLVILLIIMGGLAAAGTLMVRLNAPDRSGDKLGAPLLEEFPANKITWITIKGPESSVTLEKKADRWVVPSRFDYPADFSKIIDLVRDLKEAKIGRQFEASEETLDRLSLKDPENAQARRESKGIRIQLKGENNASIASLLLGKTRDSGTETRFPDGRYVTRGEERTVYLVDKPFSSFGPEAPGWLDKTPVEAAADDVKRVSCLRADGRATWYTLERPEKGKDLEPVSFSVSEKADSSALDRVAGALSSLRIEDVVNRAEAPEFMEKAMDTKLEYLLFSGMIYRVYLGKVCSEAESCYLKLDVDYQKPSIHEKAGGEKESAEKEAASPVKTPEEYALDAKQLNERLSPWIYKIPKWQHGAFITSRDELLEKSEESRAEKKG